MSHLLSFDTKTLNINSLVWKPTGSSCYEDAYKSNFMSAVDFLRLSEERKALQHNSMISHDVGASYVQHLWQMVEQHNDKTDSKINRLADTNPICFSWVIHGTKFSSTSLSFEVYAATQALAHAKFVEGLKSMDDTEKKKAFDDSILYLKELLPMLNEMKTKQFIIPHCPVELNMEYVKKTISVVKAFKALSLIHNDKNVKIQGNILNTSMKLFSNSWLRQKVFGELSIQHYFLSRALLYKTLAMNNKKETDTDNSKCLAAINESFYCKDQITKSLCYMSQATMKMLEDNEELIDQKMTLERINYALPCDISEIALPRAVAAE